MNPKGFKPIHALIRENDLIAPIHDRLQRVSRLQQSFADALPPGLGNSCRVAAVEGSTLIIAVANGAVAAKLKQMLPRLLVMLEKLEKNRQNKKQEQEVTVISVLVQPDYFRPEPEPKVGPPREPMPTAMVTELAESLEDSPLKKTMEGLRKKRERALTNGGRKT
ncbi:MAG: DciA family protein [Betaproteobacteria bacterium]